MKPSVNMEQKIVLPEMAIPRSEVKKPVLSRGLIGLILGVAIVALVAAGALVGVFVGKSMTRGIYKEAWVTFQIKNTNEEVRERFIVENQEVYIRRPGQFGMIYDYGKNLVTMQIDSLVVNTTGACQCKVFDFDPSSELSLEEAVKYFNQTYLVVRDAKIGDDLHLYNTGRKVDIETLSKRSKEMCLGCNILEVTKYTTKDEQSMRQRRCSGRSRTRNCFVNCRYSDYFDGC